MSIQRVSCSRLNSSLIEFNRGQPESSSVAGVSPKAEVLIRFLDNTEDPDSIMCDKYSPEHKKCHALNSEPTDCTYSSWKKFRV